MTTREDITIEIRIRITYHLAILCIDYMIAILINKLHIASTEIVFVHSVVANDIETGCLGIFRALEHTCRAIAIEQIGWLAHLGKPLHEPDHGCEQALAERGTGDRHA